MTTITLALPAGQRPDWTRAAYAIRDIRLERVGAGVDERYPWEAWLSDPADEDRTLTLPSSEAALLGLRGAQDDLLDCASCVRGVIERGLPSEVLAVKTPSQNLWITGGMNYGEDATEMLSPFVWLADSGVARAAGLTHGTQWEDPLGHRRFDFTITEMRRMHIGTCLGHIAEQAATSRDTDKNPLTGISRPIGVIAQDTDRSGHAAVKLAARWLRACCALALPSTDLDSPQVRLDAVGRGVARVIDERTLRLPKKVRSYPELAQALEASVLRLSSGRWRPPWKSIDDSRAREAAASLAQGPLMTLVSGLVDLNGADTARHLSSPPRAVEPMTFPRGGRGRLENTMAILVVGDLDWDAAMKSARKERRLPSPRLVDELELIRSILDGHSRRFSSHDFLNGIHVLCADREGPVVDVAQSIADLRTAGVLRAGGAAWASAPHYRSEHYPEPSEDCLSPERVEQAKALVGAILGDELDGLTARYQGASASQWVCSAAAHVGTAAELAHYIARGRHVNEKGKEASSHTVFATRVALAAAECILGAAFVRLNATHGSYRSVVRRTLADATVDLAQCGDTAWTGNSPEAWIVEITHFLGKAALSAAMFDREKEGWPVLDDILKLPNGKKNFDSFGHMLQVELESTALECMAGLAALSRSNDWYAPVPVALAHRIPVSPTGAHA